MSPFMKGVLGFVGCAGICGAAYAIGKHAGREEALKEVEVEEQRMAVQKAKESVKVVEKQPDIPKEPAVIEEEPKIENVIESQPTAAENVRKKHGVRNKFFGGVNVIKDLLGGNTDGKQLTMTVENGDIVARISQK